MLKIIIEIGIIFAIWSFILYLVKRKEKENISIFGPLLMLKTERGKKFIEKVAGKKFWKTYGDVAIIITSIAMFFTTFLIFRSLYYSFRIAKPISPRLAIGLPGINPVIPVGYGIASIALAIIFHEFSHGILAVFGKIKIKSLGLLFLIVPIGAFVEPDEEKLMEEKRIRRARVFSAGPSTNIFIAIVSVILLISVMLPVVTPKQTGIIVLNVIKDSPADGKLERNYVIWKINDVEMDNIEVFNKFMDSTHEGDTVNISYYYNGGYGNVKIILGNKYNFTHDKKDNGIGFIGIQTVGTKNFINLYNPFKTNFFMFISLPFNGFSPFPEELTHLYDVPAPSIFWPIFNFIYWLFWLNFALGTFNALPAIPLDGGYVFRDGIGWLIEKLKIRRGEKIASYIASLVSSAIIISIFAMFIIPNLRSLI